MTKPTVGWFEITGTDGEALRRFYSQLFDWDINDAGDDSGYGLVEAGPRGIGGGIGPSCDGGHGGVTFYVEVEDPAAFLKRAETLGGKTIVPIIELPDIGLSFALFADPEGHIVGLSKGAIQ